MTTPKVLSAVAYESINAPESAEAWIWLLSIEHPDFTPDTTLRFARAWRAISSRGEWYQPFPFAPSVSQDQPDRPARLSIRIGNVSRVITAKLETVQGSATVPVVTLEVVLGSQPSTVEYTLTDFEIRRVRYDRVTITADLEVEDWFSVGYGDLRYTPEIAPGTHRR